LVVLVLIFSSFVILGCGKTSSLVTKEDYSQGEEDNTTYLRIAGVGFKLDEEKSISQGALIILPQGFIELNSSEPIPSVNSIGELHNSQINLEWREASNGRYFATVGIEKDTEYLVFPNFGGFIDFRGFPLEREKSQLFFSIKPKAEAFIIHANIVSNEKGFEIRLDQEWSEKSLPNYRFSIGVYSESCKFSLEDSPFINGSRANDLFGRQISWPGLLDKQEFEPGLVELSLYGQSQPIFRWEVSLPKCS
jgi:hypothetical protein